MKQIIRLTESDLHRVVKESVKRIIREMEFDTPHYRNRLRGAMGNAKEKIKKERAKGDARDQDFINKKYKQMIDVSRYAHSSKDKNAKAMTLPSPAYDSAGITGPGNSGLNVNKRYNAYQSVSWENIAKEMFGEELGEKFCDWAEYEQDFDPTWYLYAYGEDWNDVDPDVDADDAFEYELEKLDSCPFLNPEQIESYKDRLRSETEDAELQYNDRYDPPDPPEPPYEYGMRYFDD